MYCQAIPVADNFNVTLSPESIGTDDDYFLISDMETKLEIPVQVAWIDDEGVYLAAWRRSADRSEAHGELDSESSARGVVPSVAPHAPQNRDRRSV